MASDPIIRTNLEGRQGIMTGIGELLERDDLQTAMGSPAFIFRLPDSVRNGDSDGYIPRRIALGPLDHFRPELYKIEFYKLHMAKMAKVDLQLPDFHQLIDQLTQLELKIRASFNTHLDLGGDTLACIMLIDALFLLRLLANVSAEIEYSSKIVSFRRRFMILLPNFEDQNLFNSLDDKLVSQFQIMSDVLKLENQIPLLVFRGILPSNRSVKLPCFLFTFCQLVSPFYLASYISDYIGGKTKNPLSAILDQSHHLLHFMYILALTKHLSMTKSRLYRQSTVPFNKFSSVFGSVLNISFPKKCLSLLVSVVIIVFMELLELLIGVVNKHSSEKEANSSAVIPSASQLQKLDVKLEYSINGIVFTEFIKGPYLATLCLPKITINSFTETVLKNLIAFEAMANLNPPALALYLQVMTALIPTPKDLKILKDQEIIFSKLESDEEVVKLFKRVSSSIPTLKKSSREKLNHLHNSKASTSESRLEAKIKEAYEEGLKGIVEEINQYYESCWRIKTERFAKMYARSVVKILAILVIGWLVSSF